ncbi:hypothetical protein [Lewinella sp. IMCC34183]|uniref:hypothetical protein n=1 Tax=Lewinella sp. IMCC34183 TaxID=2248762 RepID=UPI00130027B9|nr:hypothetical protein [Lewinella sp. IMCC34183]
MKKLSVYPVFLILLGFALLFSSACSRKSGCGVLDKTTQTKKAKRLAGKRDLFGNR